MKLRTKTLLIICVTFCVLVIILSETLNFIVSSSYSEIETQSVLKNVERVMNQFSLEYSNLQSVAFDWSNWDDTYTFMNDTNLDYIDANLNYPSLSYIKINFMLFYNNSDRLVYSKVYDFEKNTETTLPSSLYAYIENNKKSLLNNQSSSFHRSGIILCNENETPFIVCASSIVHSNGEGPVHGTLIAGRFLDKNHINSIANTTQLTISIHSLIDHSSLGSRQIVTSIKGTPVYIQAMNSTYITGNITMNDIVGTPVLTVAVGSGRPIYNQGILLIQNLILSLLIISIVFIVLIIIILDRFVTSRLTYLSNSVSDITRSRDLSRKIQTKGNDEIANLGNKIDTMLTSLHKAWTMKDFAEMSLEKKIDELERFKSITIDREMKMIELKKQLTEYKAQLGEKK
jgi:sensor domain CHASE-containing protein